MAPPSAKDFEDLVHSHFTIGAKVEVSSTDEGFRGSWFTGTIISPITKSDVSKNVNKVVVEYDTLFPHDNATEPLREELDVVHLRPIPPRENFRIFKLDEEVDAYYNDGWWEGVITSVLEDDGKYLVFFRASREQLPFMEKDLRLHREWFYGDWIPPLEIDNYKDRPEQEVVTEKTSEDIVDRTYSPGELIEVCSDEEGFQGAWFAATIVEQIDNRRYVIEYKLLRNDENTEFAREEADSLHIRPTPPDKPVSRFEVLQRVDALYKDGWWVGVVYQVCNRRKYIVFFTGTNEKMEFNYSDLRIHQDWIDGKWVIPPKALKF